MTCDDDKDDIGQLELMSEKLLDSLNHGSLLLSESEAKLAGKSAELLLPEEDEDTRLG